MKEKLWFCKFCYFILVFFILNFIKYAGGNETFELDIDKVNYVYHRAGIMALLKARGKTLIKSGSIPYPDQVIYEQCARVAQTPIALAKCVVKLLNIKDSYTYQFQQDSPTAIEKFGELFFGKSIQLSSAAKIMDTEEPLRRVVPANGYGQKAVFEESYPKIEYPKPVAAKEFYLSPNIGRSTTFKEPLRNQEDLYFRQRSGLKQVKITNSSLVRSMKPKNQFYYHTQMRRRVKKDVSKNENAPKTPYQNLANLEKLTHYYKTLSYCENFFKRLNDDNSNFIKSSSKVPYQFELRKNTNLTVIEKVLTTIEGLLTNAPVKDKFSFLSPHLFSILPTERDKRKKLLSPSIFSFHKDDGLFSLPNIFKQFDVSDNTKQEWLETLLELSGTSKTLSTMVADLEPQMKDLEEKTYPAVIELEKIEQNWQRVRESYTFEQKADIEKYGYAFLEPEQVKVLYSQNRNSKLSVNLDEYANLSKEERQRRIDDDIRKLARMNEKFELQKLIQYNKNHRNRRQAHPDNGEVTTGNGGDHHDYSQEAPGTHGSPIHFVTMSPWAFGSRIGQGFALEVVTLSPYAFFTEVMMAEALGVNTLGPRAFVPAILTPIALTARILSPGAFLGEVLSPRALTAYVLTPEALVAEVLVPKFLEVRILSPEALFIQVLSPSIIAPRIASPEAIGLLILSPSILSPRIESGHTMVVEILSPHILGGGHSSHEDAEQGIPHMHQHDEHQDHRDVAQRVQNTATGQAQQSGHGTANTGAGNAPHFGIL